MLNYDDLRNAYPKRPRKGFMPILVLCFIGTVLGLCSYYIPNMWYIKKDIIAASNGTEDLLNLYCMIGFIGGSSSIGLGLLTCVIIGRKREKLGVFAVFQLFCFAVLLGLSIAYFLFVNNIPNGLVILSNIPWLGMAAYYGMAASASLAAITFIVEAFSICAWPSKYSQVKVAIKKMLECYPSKRTRKQMKRRLKIDWKYEQYEYVLDDLYFPRVGRKDDNSPIDRDVYEYIVYKQKQDYAKIKSTELDLLYAANDYAVIRGRYYKGIQMSRARFEYHVGPNSRIARKLRKNSAVKPTNAVR